MESVRDAMTLVALGGRESVWKWVKVWEMEIVSRDAFVVCSKKVRIWVHSLLHHPNGPATKVLMGQVPVLRETCEVE